MVLRLSEELKEETDKDFESSEAQRHLAVDGESNQPSTTDCVAKYKT